MNTSEFDTLRTDTVTHAIAARKFAASLEKEEPRAARTWHALADRLTEAADQIDNMGKVLIVR